MLLHEHRGSRNRPGRNNNCPFGYSGPFAFSQPFEHQITGQNMDAWKTVIRPIGPVNEIDQPVGQPRFGNFRTPYGRLVEIESDVTGDESQAKCEQRAIVRCFIFNEISEEHGQNKRVPQNIWNNKSRYERDMVIPRNHQASHRRIAVVQYSIKNIKYRNGQNP